MRATAEQLCILTDTQDASEPVGSAVPPGDVQHPQVLMDHSLPRLFGSGVLPGHGSEH